jgi:hypothetical protein
VSIKEELCGTLEDLLHLMMGVNGIYAVLMME